MKNVCGLTPVVHCFLCLAEPTLGLWAKVQREDKEMGEGHVWFQELFCTLVIF